MAIARRTAAVIVVMGAAVLALGYDGLHLMKDRRFNKEPLALQAGGQMPGDVYRQFARAISLQQEDRFRDAARAYAAIEAAPGSGLWIDVKYNLANLYFREAARLREADAQDLAMPLVELAKQHYKDILRLRSEHWNAKYNLEIALIVAPDLDAVDALEEVNPEHSTRALTVIQSREPLP